MCFYISTRTLGAYGPLVLAPAEGLQALWDPYFNNNLYLCHFLTYLGFPRKLEN